MGKIVIEVDSVIQTKEEISGFTKYIVDKIKDDLELMDVDTFVRTDKTKDNYNLKTYLPEII